MTSSNVRHSRKVGSNMAEFTQKLAGFKVPPAACELQPAKPVPGPSRDASGNL
jgi:hypothetical protein